MLLDGQINKQVFLIVNGHLLKRSKIGGVQRNLPTHFNRCDRTTHPAPFFENSPQTRQNLYKGSTDWEHTCCMEAFYITSVKDEGTDYE